MNSPIFRFTTGLISVLALIIVLRQLSTDMGPSDLPGLEPAMMDLGRIPTGAQVSVRPRVRNNSRTTLTFRDVMGSCGCQILKASTFTLPPGSSVDLPFEINFLGKDGAGVLLVSGVPDRIGDARVILATIEYSIDQAWGMTGFVSSSDAEFSPVKDIEIFVEIEAPDLPPDDYPEALELHGDGGIDFDVVDTWAEGRDIGPGVEDPPQRIRAIVRINALLHDLNGMIKVVAPTSRSGLRMAALVPVAFESGVVLRPRPFGSGPPYSGVEVVLIQAGGAAVVTDGRPQPYGPLEGHEVVLAYAEATGGSESRLPSKLECLIRGVRHVQRIPQDLDLAFTSSAGAVTLTPVLGGDATIPQGRNTDAD